jgi:hypothetical protein
MKIEWWQIPGTGRLQTAKGHEMDAVAFVIQIAGDIHRPEQIEFTEYERIA